MYFYLKKLGSGGGDALLLLRDGENLAGRSRSVGLRLLDREISGRHFRIDIDGEQARITNLSSHGTMLDGEWIEGTLPLSPGQVLTAGGKINLEFVSADDIAGLDFINEADGSGTEQEPFAEVAETILPASPTEERAAETRLTGIDHVTLDDDEGVTMFGVDQSGTSDAGDLNETRMGETQVLKTRVASEEEIEFLRRQRGLALKKRDFKRIAFLIFIGLVLLLMWINRSPDRESSFTWPQKDGKFQTGYSGLKGGGHDRGSYSVYYPLASRTRVEAGDSAVTVNTFLGRDEAVPMNLLLTRENDMEQLGMTGPAAFRRWISQVSGNAADAWNFGAISGPHFTGEENGLPYFSCEYRRGSGNSSWYGVANLFRNGKELAVLRIEVPFEEERRCRALVNGDSFLLADREYIRGNWSGTPAEGSGDGRKRLESVREKLPGVAFNNLHSLEEELRTVLRDSLRGGDANSYSAAQEQLKLLRERLRMGFNVQEIKRRNAMADHDELELRTVRNESEAIFSNPEDARYYRIRLNR